MKNIVSEALAEIEKDIRKPGKTMNNSRAVAMYVRLKHGRRICEKEIFTVLFFNAKNQLVGEEDYPGTIDKANVYPREIVKKALEYHAVACVCVHNHPSGCPIPGDNDKEITERLKNALQLLDIILHDHVIIAPGNKAYSFTEGSRF